MDRQSAQRCSHRSRSTTAERREALQARMKRAPASRALRQDPFETYSIAGDDPPCGARMDRGQRLRRLGLPTRQIVAFDNRISQGGSEMRCRLTKLLLTNRVLCPLCPRVERECGDPVQRLLGSC